MSTQNTDIIAEIERRRVALSTGLLNIYNYYRMFIGLAILVAYQQDLFATKLGSLEPGLFLITAVIYTGVNVASALFHRFVPRAWGQQQNLSLGLVIFDVLSLTVIMFTSGGISSGVAALILITVVTGAILVTGRRATFIAALASIAVLYEEFYLRISTSSANDDFLQAGIFGVIYFAASFTIQRLSNRIRQNDIRALTQAVELADLERLNRQIIQRMRTGIIVVDQNNDVRMLNQSARALMGTQSEDNLDKLPAPLHDALSAWRANTDRREQPFQISATAPAIRANFSAVRNDDANGDVTIFLEDTGEIQQQAQQLKLAELGRLSASIAHEVRNPLGAISHAAQLLNESEELQPPDQRLTDIIISHCHRMNGVVENVLEMSRRARPEPQRVNLLDHLKEFSEAFCQSQPEARLDIAVTPATTEIRMDPNQLSQALTNLVDNGIRYSKENGNGPTVRLEGGMDPGSGRPFLNIVDNGQGVEDELVDSLFQPFTTSSRKGTGLGLYLSRELCESNQAQLSYAPTETGGSCFRILFAHPNRLTA